MLALLLLLGGATASPLASGDYGDPRKGCATGDMPAKFPFGGCMCMPKCTGTTCPAAPGGTAKPICEFSANGKPPPTYCGLKCTASSQCPTGTSCELPTGICAFPYPVGEPEGDEEAPLTTLYSAAPTPAPTFVDVPFEGTLPVPTPQQLKYQGEISALIHFGMATFFHDGDPGCTAQNWHGCDPKGGCNSSDVSSFNPTNLNVSAWVDSFEALGATSAVLTAKHGCGFLAWKTNTTLPDGSPYRYHVPDNMPVLEDFVAATEAAGIGHGFYYSLTNNFYLNAGGHNARPKSTALPGQAPVTQAEYEALQLAQVKELWNNFGELTEIWMDGGCGAMCDKIGALVKTSTGSRNAVAFNGGGSSKATAASDSPVRWCGTEGGFPKAGQGRAVWSTAACGWCPSGSGSGAPPNTTGAYWYPSGVDITIQAGDHWFFTPGDGLRPLHQLIDMYHASVGTNGHLEIDFGIDRTGGVDPKHAACYAGFGGWIRSCYGTPVAQGALKQGATSIEVPFTKPTSVDRIRLEEDQTAGQKIISYTVEAKVGGAWQAFSAGVTVGAKRIDVAEKPVTASGMRVTVTEGFGKPTGLTLFAFAPGPCATADFEYEL